MSTRLMSVREVATELGLSEYEVYAEVRRLVMPCKRPGGRLIRFTREDIDTYLERISSKNQPAATGQTAASRRRRRTA